MREQVVNNLNLFEDEISTIFERYEDYVEKNRGQICALVEEQFPNWDREYGIHIFLFKGTVMAKLTIDGENKTVYYTKEGWSQRFVKGCNSKGSEEYFDP